MNLLVTGGCGFIGSRFIHRLLQQQSDCRILNIDSMTYAAHPQTNEALATLGDERYAHVPLDIANPEIGSLIQKMDIDAIVNFAAESHVDRSILDPGAFIHTNVQGVQNLLNLARQNSNVRFVQVSTDEVYGSLDPHDPPFNENSPLAPNSPYAASKAGGDLLVQAAYQTHRQDVVITRATNNFGPYQFPEKLIPLVIANALEDKRIPVYGDGQQVRDWLYVDDHCRAIETALLHGKAGMTYLVSGDCPKTNLDLIRALLDLLGKPHSLIEHVRDRPGHDRRYALDPEQMKRTLNWTAEADFDRALFETVNWYVENPQWWKTIRDKSYYDYYRANYDPKKAEVRP